MNRLPYEVVLEVFEFLSSSDLVSASQVNRQFRDLCVNDANLVADVLEVHQPRLNFRLKLHGYDLWREEVRNYTSTRTLLENRRAREFRVIEMGKDFSDRYTDGMRDAIIARHRHTVRFYNRVFAIYFPGLRNVTMYFMDSKRSRTVAPEDCFELYKENGVLLGQKRIIDVALNSKSCVILTTRMDDQYLVVFDLYKDRFPGKIEMRSRHCAYLKVNETHAVVYEQITDRRCRFRVYDLYNGGPDDWTIVDPIEDICIHGCLQQPAWSAPDPRKRNRHQTGESDRVEEVLEPSYVTLSHSMQYEIDETHLYGIMMFDDTPQESERILFSVPLNSTVPSAEHLSIVELKADETPIKAKVQIHHVRAQYIKFHKQKGVVYLAKKYPGSVPVHRERPILWSPLAHNLPQKWSMAIPGASLGSAVWAHTEHHESGMTFSWEGEREQQPWGLFLYEIGPLKPTTGLNRGEEVDVIDHGLVTPPAMDSLQGERHVDLITDGYWAICVQSKRLLCWEVDRPVLHTAKDTMTSSNVF